jgi:hypothetical protein
MMSMASFSNRMVSATLDVLNRPIAAVPAPGSLPDVLHKDGSLTYDSATDSLEALRDQLDTRSSQASLDAVDAVVDAIGAAVDAVDTVVDAVKAKTDGLNFTDADVKATLDGESVTVGDKTGFSISGTLTTLDQLNASIETDGTYNLQAIKELCELARPLRGSGSVTLTTSYQTLFGNLPGSGRKRDRFP